MVDDFGECELRGELRQIYSEDFSKKKYLREIISKEKELFIL